MSLALWLESLTMEETFFLTYGVIFGLMLLVFAPIAVWIDKKTRGGKVGIRYELKPCPNCGGWCLMRGKPFKLGTPRIVVLIRSIFRHGITCIECGHYRPTVRAWNRESEVYNGK